MDLSFMGRDSHDPRGRLSAFLRKVYPAHGAKLLANSIGCTPKTAENIIGGHWPRAEHMAGIVRLFGRDVLDAVFGPEIEATVSKLEQEVRDLERQLDAKRTHLRQTKGAVSRAQGGLAEIAPVETRSFWGEP